MAMSDVDVSLCWAGPFTVDVYIHWGIQQQQPLVAAFRSLKIPISGGNHVCSLTPFLHFSGPCLTTELSLYGIVFRGLEGIKLQRYSDAVQLLKLFSFLHHGHIPFNILIAAVKHPRIQREAPRGSTLTNKGLISWTSRGSFGVFVNSVMKKQLENRNPVILSTFLWDAELSLHLTMVMLASKWSHGPLVYQNCLTCLVYHMAMRKWTMALRSFSLLV